MKDGYSIVSGLSAYDKFLRQDVSSLLEKTASDSGGCLKGSGKGVLYCPFGSLCLVLNGGGQSLSASTPEE